ncbi:MAG: uroporphyrinogen-III C-methyltransferase [Anaerolineales bacterium]|uniref:uroporphyrinogen-III C-methyltransferase n=1 Tax=Candidatus Desulfolinea nitratireducens TaxID=2841698 RepID=A0A8J6NPB7_9CHLR|nr:uroporphyrinogen-III C-methyltransferase [Candidatus Desulfolinea nitratireducens]MBL6959658.1 uroporphyrinogen-III C-methyltransferase [Anaerolineales bacterium]
MLENNYTNNTDNSSSGIVYLVGAGPGDPGLLTLRGLECLQKADLVVHDRLANQQLLAHAPQAEIIDVGKKPDHHPTPQERINAILVEEAQKGKVIVRLKGGDPFVFGRGGEEALSLAKAGIPFEIIPGVTSAISVPAYAGIPVTQRGVACSVAFITGHCAGSKPLDVDWQALSQGVDTLVFLMGVHSLKLIVTSLLKVGRSPETPIALIERGTLPEQKVVTGTLDNILEEAADIEPPAIIIIGKVVSLHPTLEWFKSTLEISLMG